MKPTRKPSAPTRVAQQKKPEPDIQECPAYEICRKKGTDCSICKELPVEAWREHVKNVMAMS
jgi:hypothetical protein